MSTPFFTTDDDDDIKCQVCGEEINDDWSECPICGEILTDADEFPSDMNVSPNGEQRNGSADPTTSPNIAEGLGIDRLTDVIRMASEKIEGSIFTLTHRIGRLIDKLTEIVDGMKDLRDVIDDCVEQEEEEDEREIPQLPPVATCDKCENEMSIIEGHVICPICDIEEPEQEEEPEERTIDEEDDEADGFFDEEEPPDYDIEAHTKNLCKINGIGPAIAQKLMDMEPPIQSADDIIDRGPKKLRKSFGKATVDKIMTSAKKFKKKGR